MEKQKSGTQAELLEQVRQYPTDSGVYLMKAGNGTILYVGKANSLRVRLLSYFRDQDGKTAALMEQVRRIDYVVTSNGFEALLLEINLIKQWMPRYNVDLKDGKSYPVVRVTAEEYPRVVKTRNIIKDGSRYYGPYIEVRNLVELLEILGGLYPLRKCRGNLRAREHPCLHYHIGRCAAPCAGKIGKAEYLERIKKVENVLSGKTGAIKQELHKQISDAIATENFERGAQLRDALQAIKLIEQDQQITTINEGSVDYVGYYARGKWALFTLFQTREGRLVGLQQFTVDNVPNLEEQVANVIIQYYENAPVRPGRIVVPAERADERESEGGGGGGGDAGAAGAGSVWQEVTDYFSHKWKLALVVTPPGDSRDRTLLRLAMRNSEAALATRVPRSDVDLNEDLVELKDTLGLPVIPEHIEGIDIAHIGGSHTVAAVVHFRGGKPLPSRYRRFALRTLDGKVDDFEAMREVVARRYSRLVNENKQLPQLILIDGGLGQVNAAAKILASLGLGGIPLVGIAKQHEEIYLPDTSEPLALPHDSQALRVLVRVRDQAHRFATSYRAGKQRKDIAATTLRTAPGVGVRREALLLGHFGSVGKIKAAAVEEIVRVSRMGRAQAEALLDYLNK